MISCSLKYFATLTWSVHNLIKVISFINSKVHLNDRLEHILFAKMFSSLLFVHSHICLGGVEIHFFNSVYFLFNLEENILNLTEGNYLC